MPSPSPANVLLLLLFGVPAVAESAELELVKLVVAEAGGAAFTINCKAEPVTIKFEPPLSKQDDVKRAVAESLRVFVNGEPKEINSSVDDEGIEITQPRFKGTCQVVFVRTDVSLVYRNEVHFDASGSKATFSRRAELRNPLAHAFAKTSVTVVSTLASVDELGTFDLPYFEGGHVASATLNSASGDVDEWRVKIADSGTELEPVRAKFAWDEGCDTCKEPDSLRLPKKGEPIRTYWKANSHWRSLASPGDEAGFQIAGVTEKDAKVTIDVPVFRADATVTTRKYVGKVENGLLSTHEWHEVEFEGNAQCLGDSLVLEPSSKEWEVCSKHEQFYRERKKEAVDVFGVELSPLALRLDSVLAKLEELQKSVTGNNRLSRAVGALKKIKESGLVGDALAKEVEEYNRLARTLDTKACSSPNKN